MLLVIGCGYVGQYFLDRRKEKKSQHITTTTSSQKVDMLKHLANEVIELHGNELSEIEKVIEKIDVIVVLVAPSRKQNYEDVYLATAKNIARILSKRQRPLHLICASTTFVYQGIKGVAYEDMPFMSSHARAQLLHDVEQIYLSCKNSHTNVTVVRLGGIYGPNRQLEQRAAYICGEVLPGAPDEPTNHIHVEDVASFIWYCIDNKIDGVVNLVNDSHPSRRELYDTLCDQLSLARPKFDKTKPAYHGCGCIVSNKKSKDLGFVFLHPQIQSPKPLN
jgi:nucleoside-diphosphate-sugar epimerase